MALDATARTSNYRDSVIKYFVDGMPGVELSFDKSLTTPKIQGSEVDRWVVVQFAALERGSMSSAYVELIACTRKDPEGFRLAQLADLIYNLCKDSTKTDGMARISLYRSSATEAWVRIGAILITEIRESGEMDYDDLTKYKIITLRLQWASCV